MLVSRSPMGKPYQPKDHFFREAKRRGLRARSAFKLDEVIDRFRLAHRGSQVLDLGAAPGGFLQVLAKAVGPEANVNDADFDAKLAAIHEGHFDTVISDLAPKTTGIRTTDEARSLALATRAADIARRWGASGSAFLAKLFMGGDFETFRSLLRARYRQVKVVRPEATRARSIEVYLLGLGKK